MIVKFTHLYKLISEKKKILSKINSLIKNSEFVGGNEVLSFEKEFSSFTGARFCVSVGNGTDALEIAIKSLNLKNSSEIIVPNNTWISTAEAVVANGHKVVLCDVNLGDYTICLNDLKKKITRNTRAIIPVHLYGNPADVEGIKKIIRGKNIKIIEDCAQAHGSLIDKKHVGTFGEVSCFSFFPGKNLGAFGDAGAIITNNKKIYNFCLRHRNHGSLNKYDHKFSGRNSRLDTIQAAILRIKLKSYLKVIKKRNYLASVYFKELKELNYKSDLQLFKLKDQNNYSFHQFVIRTRFRNKLRIFLTKSGIETMIHYPYMLNDLKIFSKKLIFKNSNRLGAKILSLPISEEHSFKDVSYICGVIKNFFKKNTMNLNNR
jgi:dTDP-4-amino-4,6-dideoxygalactose transaminase